jgi:cytochrome c5
MARSTALLLAVFGFVVARAGHTAEPLPGEAPYRTACAACHDNGTAGAPRLGDRAAWAPRLKQGMDALYRAGLYGKPGTAMVAKGGYARLSDAEVRAAVDVLVARAR